MAKKVSKNQRTDRGKGTIAKNMAKIVVAEKKANGEYSYRQKMVTLDEVQNEIRAARARS